MSNHRFRIKLKTPLLLLLLYLLISGLVLSFSSGGFLVNFKEVGFTIVSSFQKGIHTISSSVSDFFTAMGKLASLRKENAVLQEKLKDYNYMQRNNADIRKENERLKEQLGFTENYEYVNHPAQIIGREPNALYSGITVNKGTHQGIRKGMPVIAVQNGDVGLIGKVISVGYGTSVVMPVYDYNCNVSVRIESTRDIGLLSGTGSADSNLDLKYIKKRALENLNIGDIVVTSGENANYMKDMPVGTISNINILDYDNSLDIEVKPLIDFSKLETVIIVDINEIREDE